MEWIKCSERMPEEYQRVFTKNAGAHAKAIFFTDESGGQVFQNYTARAGVRVLHNVTEWMPQPPEE